MKQIEDATADHPTTKQREIGHELISITAKNVTQTNNLTIRLAFALFASKSSYSLRQQSDAVIWTMCTGDFAESTPRNEYIHDLCVEFGGTVYTSLIDSKNGIKKSAENTNESTDYVSFGEQLKAVEERMKEAVKCLSGMVFLRNNGAINIKVLSSSKSVHDFLQCELATGEYKTYNKSGVKALAPLSPQSEAQKREKELSDARSQKLELAILKLMSVLVDDKGVIGRLSDIKDATEQSALVRLYQTLNVYMHDQESLIEKYVAEDNAITEALNKSEPVAKEA